MPAEHAPLPIDSSLLFKLIRLVNLTARPFSETLGKQHRLSLNEWRTLVVLASHPGGAATEVAELTGLDKMSVSRAVAALLGAGRIEKRDDPRDQRRSRLFLTPQGASLFGAIGEQARQREVQVFAGVPEAELKKLDATLDRLLAAALLRSEAE